jgi:hypothetical protein
VSQNAARSSKAHDIVASGGVPALIAASTFASSSTPVVTFIVIHGYSASNASKVAWTPATS